MLAHLQDRFNKPYYFFRPSQVLLHLKRKLLRHQPNPAYEQVVLPWGLPLRVRPSDTIGAAIFRTGVYDLCVSEVLWRLLDQGETAVDAGANIGHMTSVMAKRVSGSGRVLSFEPHPQVFQELSSNVALWTDIPNTGLIELYEIGLSRDNGVASLHTTSEFSLNRGTASLEANDNGETKTGVAHSIIISRLDDVLDESTFVGVMKIDVEGHEINLLQGSARLLTEHRIRDIVFEDHGSYPTHVTEHLERLGYTIFSIEQGPLTVRVSPAREGGAHYKYEAKSYLATLNKHRALDRLNRPGYQLMLVKRDTFFIKVAYLVATLLLTLTIWLSMKRERQK